MPCLPKASFLMHSLVSAKCQSAPADDEALTQLGPGPVVCRVPLIAFPSFNYKFQLQTWNPAKPEVHNKLVRFIGQGTPGDYRAVLYPSGSDQQLEFVIERREGDQGDPTDNGPGPELRQSLIVGWGGDGRGGYQGSKREREGGEDGEGVHVHGGCAWCFLKVQIRMFPRVL